MSKGAMGVPIKKSMAHQDVEMMEAETDDSDFNEFDTSDDDQPFDTAPLKIDWLDVSPYDLPGKLGVSDLPGCRFGEVWRKLKSDVDDLKKMGFSDMFLLCTKAELTRYRVPNLLSEYAMAMFCIHHFPIDDETSPEITNILQIIQQVKDILSCGKKVLLHCYGGLGRSCMVAACLLLQLDQEMNSATAIEKVRELRGHKAIETVKQYNFVNDYRRLAEDCQEEISTVGGQRSVSR